MTTFRSFKSIVFAAMFLLVGPALSAVAAPHYYMVMFGAQAARNQARTSHTFATFVKVDDGYVEEEQTISWLPAPGYFGPNNAMPLLGIVPGHNYSLDETIALSPGRRVQSWGPYEITPALYRRAAARVAFLESGVTSYKMMVLLRDRLRMPALNNQPGGAINCIMAVSDIAGLVDTGTAWGFEASSQVLQALSPQVVGGLWVTHPEISPLLRLRERLP